MKNQDYFSQEDLLAQILKELQRIAQKLPNSNSPAEQLGVIDTADLIRLLKITPRTAIAWRKQKILPFSKVGGKYFYQISDIQEMMQKRFSK